jgi:flagellar protein FliS
MNRGIILTYNNALSSYKETRIKTASQGQLVIILYDEAVKQLNKALDLLELNNSMKKEPGRIEQISKAVMKAEEIITELIISLDFEQGGEISKNLFALYTWFNKELIEANIAQDTKRMTTVRNMLSDLRSTWNTIFSKANTETVNRESVGINIAG